MCPSDLVCGTQNLLGKNAPYVTGWDCHGMPIEWKVEEQYRKKKLDKKAVPANEFRAECRAYAQHWVDTQREQLKRLGINGDWDNPYLTMDFAAEATIDGHTVLVHSSDIAAPEQVRFGWHTITNPNLVNSAGLPASPFQTKDWRGGTGK